MINRHDWCISISPSAEANWSKHVSAVRRFSVHPKASWTVAGSRSFGFGILSSYVEYSLKDRARKKRGHGLRIRVSSQSHTPKNWQQFLLNVSNKTELFSFLSGKVSRLRVNGKQILATQGNSVLSAGFDEMNSKLCRFPCNHEEADTMLILHAAHASAHGHRALTVRTLDTDVVVLAITFWVEIACETLWIAFGVVKHFRYIPVHEVANALGP